MIEFLFLDLDDTIFDFHKAEHLALEKTLREFGLEPTKVVLDRYSLINRAHWERLERKELTREEVLVGRFLVLFREFGLSVDPEQCARKYEANLAVGHYFLPGAPETLERLSREYKLYLASNGTSNVQHGRLSGANISQYFQEIFISQEMGANKPDLMYFQRCFERIPDFDPNRAMIVGDSLTSDILGGINAGLHTCWINPEGKSCPENMRPEYTLQALHQLPDLLKCINK